MSNVAREIFDDLLSLEVDVILKPTMTGRKMPDIPQALIDITVSYDSWLRAKLRDWNPLWAALLADAANPLPADFAANEPGKWLVDVQGVPLRGIVPEEVLQISTASVTAATFDTLRSVARQVEALHQVLQRAGVPVGDDGAPIMARRIRRNCDQIKGILEGRDLTDDTSGTQRVVDAQQRGISRATKDPRALPLTADEVLVVRKVWEVGTEEILMQTVVQLDGDVITRVRTGWEGAANKPIHDLHRDAVGTAMTHWQFLVETLVQITSKAAGFLAR